MNKNHPTNKRPQTPHPKEKGKATNGTILDNPAKVAAWQARWNREFAHRWVERGGKLYPRNFLTTWSTLKP